MRFRFLASVAAVLLPTVVVASLHHGGPDSVIQRRQAVIHKLEPRAALKKRSFDVLNDISTMHGDLEFHQNSITSLCGQLPKATPAQCQSIGAQINAHLESCHQIVSHCGGGGWGGGGGDKPPPPKPSGVSGGGGNSGGWGWGWGGFGNGGNGATCNAAAGVYAGTLHSLQGCANSVESVLHYIPDHASSIKGTLSDLDGSCKNVLDSADNALPGFGASCSLYTSGLRTVPASSSGLCLSNTFSHLQRW